MISNLFVVDKCRVDERNHPLTYADIFDSRVVIHPKFLDKLLEGFYGMRGKDEIPIVITAKEWHQMVVFSTMLADKTEPPYSEGMKFVRASYQWWWDNICKRAKKDHENYGKKTDNNSKCEGKG